MNAILTEINTLDQRKMELVTALINQAAENHKALIELCNEIKRLNPSYESPISLEIVVPKAAISSKSGQRKKGEAERVLLEVISTENWTLGKDLVTKSGLTYTGVSNLLSTWTTTGKIVNGFKVIREKLDTSKYFSYKKIKA